jgi:hypothetical protein
MTTLRLSVPKARDAYNRTPVPLRLDPADKITTSITHAGGTGIIYYKSTDTVTETSNDGTLTAGQTLYLTATVYLLASVATDISVEQSAGSLTKAEFSRLRAYGHSYLQDSTGASVVDKAFVNIVTGMLGAQSENMAIGGSSSYLAAPGVIRGCSSRRLRGSTPPGSPTGSSTSSAPA